MAARKKWGGRRKGSGRKTKVQDPVRITLIIESPDLEHLTATAQAEGKTVADVLRKVISDNVKREKRKETDDNGS